MATETGVLSAWDLKSAQLKVFNYIQSIFYLALNTSEIYSRVIPKTSISVLVEPNSFVLSFIT